MACSLVGLVKTVLPNPNSFEEQQEEMKERWRVVLMLTNDYILGNEIQELIYFREDARRTSPTLVVLVGMPAFGTANAPGCDAHQSPDATLFPTSQRASRVPLMQDRTGEEFVTVSAFQELPNESAFSYPTIL